MENDIKNEFEKLAGMVAEGFLDVRTQFAAVDVQFEHVQENIKSLRGELKSIQNDVAEVPGSVDETYSSTINDLLERLSVAEAKLEKLEAATS